MEITSENTYNNGYFSNGISQYTNSNILNKLDAFIFIFDVDELKPVWINCYFKKCMGYSLDDLKNLTSRDFLALFHPKSRQQFLQRMRYYNVNEDESIKTIYQIKTKFGDWINMLVCSHIHALNPDGSIKNLIGFAIKVDTFELTRHIKKIKELNAKYGNISLLNKLSKRELNVIQLIAKAFTDKEIADKLKISIHTTKTHRKRIISKLGLKNTAALVKFAVENGIC